MVVLYEDGELKIIYQGDTKTLTNYAGTLSLYRVGMIAVNSIKINFSRPNSGDTALVWDLCEENQHLSRAEIIDLSMAEGIDKVTAFTQYSDWINRKKKE